MKNMKKGKMMSNEIKIKKMKEKEIWKENKVK